MSEQCKPNVVIIGMHRSGTSLLAGTIEKMGWWVSDPEDIMLAQNDNPMGFWERQDIVDLNDELLKLSDQHWHSLFPSSDCVKPDLADTGIQQKLNAIVGQLENHQPFLIKDPRLCLTWPYWSECLTNYKIIVIVRHPLEVAKSLQARNGMPIFVGLGLWFRYIKEIERIAADKKILCIDHKRLVCESKATIKLLFKYLRPDENIENDASELQTNSIVNADLVHHQEGSKQLKQYSMELDAMWNKVRKGDFNNLPDSINFKQVQIQRELYAAWVEADTQKQDLKERESIVKARHAEINSKQNAYQNQIENLQRSNDHLQESITCIAESLLAYQSSKMYRIGRMPGTLRSVVTKKPRPDAIDKITEILADLGRIDAFAPSPNPVLEAAGLLLRNPVSMASQINRSRLKTALRMLFDAKARANFSTALSRYRVVSHARKLDLFRPGSVAIGDINLPKPGSPKVSIIIPVFNEYDSTLACIKSIEHGANEMSYEIIVADDCSSDETRQLTEFIDNLVVVRSEKNQGFLENCNHAAQYAQGEYLVFLNNDTNVQSHWLTELISPLEDDKLVGLVGSKLIYPDGRLQEAGGIIFSDGSGWNYGRLGDRLAPEFNFVRQVDYVSGASIAIRKAVWNEIKGFDELFRPAYYEDTDLCFQVRELGYQVIYTPFSEVVHYEGVSHGTDESSGIKKYQTENKHKFARKWAAQLQSAHYKDSAALFRARIHGMHRPIILIIDHYVPMHDKDAGSRSTRKYIELLVAQGIHVIFLGDNFYPHQPYTEQLQRIGVEVLYGDFYKNNWENWFKQNKASIDCVYIHRPHVAERYLPVIRTHSPQTRIVYFGHDLHYLRAEREAQVSGERALFAEAEDWKVKELKIMGAADISLFPAAYEARKVQELDTNISADHIPLYWFDESEIQTKDQNQTHPKLLFVGGFGHPPNIDGLNWFMQSIWPSIVKELPKSHLTIIGSKCPESVKKLASTQIDVLGEVSDAVLETAYSEASIAVVPLRYGAGIKGKVLEAMSKGVPVCTTTVGAEGLPESEQPYLKISDDAQNFADNVITLLSSQQEAKTLSKQASQILRQHFSQQSALTLLEFLNVEPFNAGYENES